MKLVSFKECNEIKIGIVVNDIVYDLRKAYALYLKKQGDTLAEKIAAVRIPGDMVKLIEGGEKAYKAATEAYGYILDMGNRVEKELEGKKLEDVKLAAPLIPRTIICGGANFYDHLDETKRSKPEEVEFFLKSPLCVVGPGETVEHEPKVTHKYDYEVELGIIIKKPGRFIPVEEAFDYIFGYTIFNDISARSRQVIPWSKDNFQLRFGEGKNYDTGAPVGPWIITTDELVDVSNLQLKTLVSGELRQNNNTKNLIWNVPNLVSYYSQFMTLQPGFLIASGTPGGPALGSDVELGADPYERKDGVKRGGYMKPGDVMVLEIEGIGQLVNPIDRVR
ncbi:MAG TPA: fumarylacetoacetate hydrolase family protein [Thermoanaerobacterales bacterium]|nr:fumarylacetoacetate hydrolase family protein [Thermoanaerobacterales bacterium]